MLLRHRNIINATKGVVLRSSSSGRNSTNNNAMVAAAGGLEGTCTTSLLVDDRQIIRHGSTVAVESVSASPSKSWKNHPCLQQQQFQQIQQSQQQFRCLSTKNDTNDDNDNGDTKKENNKKKETLEETINRLKNEGEGDDASQKSSKQTDDILRNLGEQLSSFSESVSNTWAELLNSNAATDINKKLHDHHVSKPGSTSEDDNEAADKYEGTTAVMVIDESENLTAYERIQRRLSEAPVIQQLYKTAEEIYEKSGAAKAGEKISHIKEDAQEAWETSQNPWVYRVSSVYDTLTAESETAMAERELRDLDPSFNLEDWKRGLVEVTLPKIMQLFLEGRIKELKPFLGEAVYNRLAAESRARKKEGVYIDTNILGIMNSEITRCAPDTLNKGSPLIAVHFMCQQINCVRKKETDEIVEGSEDDIRAYSYLIVMQREYDEEAGEIKWKILDFMLNGAIAYL